MSRTKQSLKNFAAAIVGQAFGVIISFFSRMIFVQTVGVKVLGINNLLSNIIAVLSLVELGVGEAIACSLYKPLAKRDNERCRELMELYKKLYTFIGCAIFLIGVGLLPFFGSFTTEISSIPHVGIMYILFLFNTSISYFFSYKRNLIIADQNRYIATIYRYGFYFMLNIFQIVYLLLAKDYIGFLIIQNAFTIIENLCISKKADRMYSFLSIKKRATVSKKIRKEVLKNTKAAMMHKIGDIVVTSTDNILLSKIINLSAVGIYSNYFLITNALDLIFSQVFKSLTASVGNLFAKDTQEKCYKIFTKILFLNFWIFCFSSTCLICLINPFISLWLGEEYLFTMDIVIILVVNHYIYGMKKAVAIFRWSSGLFYKDRWKSVIESSINLISSMLLGFKFGVFGVFLGTFISSITTCVWIEPYVLYKYGFDKKVKLYFKSYLKYLLITITIASSCYFLCHCINIDGYIGFAIKFIIAFILPNLTLYVIFRNTSEFQYFYKKIFKKIFKKISQTSKRSIKQQ